LAPTSSIGGALMAEWPRPQPLTMELRLINGELLAENRVQEIDNCDESSTGNQRRASFGSDLGCSIDGRQTTGEAPAMTQARKKKTRKTREQSRRRGR
jgi:hypothetical protein